MCTMYRLYLDVYYVQAILRCVLFIGYTPFAYYMQAILRLCNMYRLYTDCVLCTYSTPIAFSTLKHASLSGSVECAYDW